MAPSKRASFAMALHKARAVLFGGTADEEGKGGEVLVSNFFNDLYQLNLAQWRWYPVAMRSQKSTAGACLAGASSLCLLVRITTHTVSAKHCMYSGATTSVEVWV